MIPPISVVMPVWNGEKYLAEAVDSILAQTFTDFEFIIVDDGSHDATPSLLDSYRDSRLHLVKLEHAGIVSALNQGIARARGSWIARQDADDISKPGRLEKQWELITGNKNIVVCHTDVELIGEKSHIPRPCTLPRTKALACLGLCYCNPIAHGTALFNKEAFHRAGGYFQEERHAEDYGLWGRMIEMGDIAGIPEQLLSLRMHAASASFQNAETQSVLATSIALEHMRRFMNLSPSDARRALAVLHASQETRNRKEWLWFLLRCAPGLRWKNAEVYGWLASRTFQGFAGAQSTSR